MGSEWEFVRALGSGDVRAIALVRDGKESTLWLAFRYGISRSTLSTIILDSATPESTRRTAAPPGAQSRTFAQQTVSTMCGMNDTRSTVRMFAGTINGGVWWRSADAEWQPVPSAVQRLMEGRGIRGLSCLGDGRLLVGFGLGLAVLDVRHPNPSRWSTQSVTSQEDGLPATEINAFAPTEVNGIIWIGTSRGLGGVQLQRVTMSPTPRLTIELHSEGHALNENDLPQLRANQSDLTIRTALPSYHREDDTRYRVLLLREGEKNIALDVTQTGIADSLSWTDAPESRYRSLSAGDYTLQVWARDFAGRVVTLPPSRFRVVPPVWRSWWVMVLYALFVAAVIYSAHRWRLHTLERTNAQLATSERHMRASERKFRALFDEASDAHLLIDGPYITSINTAGRTLLELGAESTLNSPAALEVPEWRSVLPRGIVKEIFDMAEDGAVHEYEVQLTDGTILPLSAQITTVPLDDRSLWHLVLCDLRAIRASEAVRQRLEDQVRDAQKFESLGTLAGGVAHDFNNLLGVIRGNVELARDTLNDRDAVSAHLDTVFDASERARDLVRQILTFSRRSSSQEEIVDLARLTQRLHTWQTRGSSPAHAAETTIVLVDDEPAVVRVSEAALSRLGYQVVAFVDPVAALAFVEQDPSGVDLVVTDQTMPGLTGDLLVMQLQKLRPDLPVIIMSGFSYVLTAERLSAMGTPTVLQKPVSLADLRLAVERALEARALATRG